MKIKKRRKSSRFRGSHTHGRGFKKKARGSGHRGGFGMAGTGKRADHRKSFVLNLYGKDYFGKDKALRKKSKKKLRPINIRDIVLNFDSLIKSGIAKESKDKIELNFEGCKILAKGDDKISKGLIINASAASKKAIEKIKEAGGDIVIKK